MRSYLLTENINIHKSVLIFYAFLLLTVPIRWLFAAALSALIHEMFHIAAVLLCKKQIVGIEIGVFGAEIQMGFASQGAELFCLAAGPFGSLSLLGLFKWLPLTSFFGCIQGLFNLIPVLPLDGGRMLQCVLRIFFRQDIVNIIMITTEIFAFLLITLASFVSVFILETGTWPIVVPILLGINRISGKTPCKLRQLGVQ